MLFLNFLNVLFAFCIKFVQKIPVLQQKTLMQNSVAIFFNRRTGRVNYFSIQIRYTRKLEIRYCSRSRTIAYIG